MKLRCFLFAAVILTGSALAQDPPSRVARLNWISGDVSFQPAGIDNWTAASLNYPLTTGDHIYTDTGSRAEMHIGPNALRLDQRSNFGFLNLDDQTAQVRFTGGSLEVRVRRLDDDEVYEIDTPQGAISLLRTGDYRIDTDPDRNATMVTVRGGEVIVSANGTSFPVHARQTVYFADGVEPDIRDANPADDFDRFTQSRNAREDRVPAPVHVDPEMVGYEDLDANGVWSNDPGYGWVWAPRVEVGWAPYHHGRWAWVEPWGWTWIDEAPWGFAPFHYGRWAYLGVSWVWVPGAVVRRPVYAPALVAFVRTPGFSIGIGMGGGVGAVAWFPLGPREAYYPSYRVSNTYVRQVNITHVTNINVTNINNNVTNVRYVNQQVPGAVTAVPQNAFTASRPVAQVAQTVSPAQMAQARVVGTAPAVAPERQSVLGNAGVNARVAQPSQAVMNRQVVARATPPPPPVRFEAKQQLLSQSQGRPLAPDQITEIRQQQPAAVVNRPQVRAASVAAPAMQARPSAVPAPMVQPRPAQPNPVSAPVTPPADRMDSRPPNARPLPGPAQAAPVQTPRDQTFQRQNPQVAPRPIPENRPTPPVEARPVPQMTPRAMPPEARVPEARPEPAARPAPAPRSEPAARPEPARPAPAKEEKKDEVKSERGR